MSGAGNADCNGNLNSNANDANNAIRVGLSTTMMEPSLTHGRLDGIGVYTNALRHNLPEAGCAVQGFSFPPPSVSLGQSSMRSSMRSSMFTVGAPMPHSYELSSLIDLATPGAHRCHMPMDLFHVTDYRIVRMDCPVVATLHDAVPIKYPHWCTPRLRGLKNWLQKKAAKKADHVIALSHYAVTELVECFGIDPERISVVYCGVGAAWELPQAPEAVAVTLAAYGLRPGYFLFVGTLQPRKNVERILQAYLSLPQAQRAAHQLVIVGRAGWQCDDLILQLSAAQQNGENVVWLNQLTDEAQLRHVYAGAAVFVFPSLYEGFGIPVLEAFSSGVPVVTSNTTSLPEVSQGAALEVDPTSVAQIAAAMLTLVRDEACRTRCIAAGRQRVAQLTWRQTALQTVEVYRSVLSA